MRGLRRWLGWTAVLALAVALAATGAGVLYLRTPAGEAWLQAQVAAAVARAGGRVTISRLRVQSLRRFELQGLQLSFRRQSMLRARRVTLVWAPLALAWGEVRIRTLEVEHPRVRLVRREGSWGFSDAGDDDPTPALRIHLRRIRVVDGRLAIEMDGDGEPMRLAFRDVDAEGGVLIGWLATQVNLGELRARAAGLSVSPFALRGGVALRRGRTRIDAQLATSRSSAAVALTIAEGGVLGIDASTPRLARDEVRRLVPSIALTRDVAGHVSASGTLDALDATVALDAGPAVALRARGTVDATSWPPRVDVDTAGSHADVGGVGRVDVESLRVRGGGAAGELGAVGVVGVAGGRLSLDGRVRTRAAEGVEASAAFEAPDLSPWGGVAGSARGTVRVAGGVLEGRVGVSGPEGRVATAEGRVTGLRGAWSADVTLDAADPALGTLQATCRVEPVPAGIVLRIATLAIARHGGDAWQLAGPATMRWDGTSVTTDALSVARGGSRLRLQGRVSPRAGPDALALAVRAEPLDVADLREWMPAGVESVTGGVDATATIRGALAAPVIEGEGTLVAPRVVATGLGVIEDVRVRARARSGEAVLIESLEARTRDGTITGSGTVGLSGGEDAPIRADLRLSKLVIARRPLYRAVVGGRVQVSGTVVAPRLDAKLRIPRGVVRPRLLPEEGANVGEDPTITVVGEPAAEPEPSAAEALALVTIRATIALGDEVFLRRKDADIRLTGDLAVDKDLGGPFRLGGTIALREGWYVFKGRRFDVRSGTVQFTGVPTIDPELRIRARHRAPDYVVWVDVGGVASAPTLMLTSEPPLAEADVLAVLLFGRPASELRGEEQGVVQREAQSVAFSYVAPALAASARQILPFDRIEVSGEELLLARHVTEDIFISLGQELTARGGQTVGIEYDLTPRTSLKLSTSTRGSSAIDFFWRRRY